MCSLTIMKQAIIYDQLKRFPHSLTGQDVFADDHEANNYIASSERERERERERYIYI